ncbi:unnamed protein product [Linum tenue]|uniref:Uncharacterized protein n=1 Tax=Linum tenue TaxID=586396 RepID=A0AAV0IEV4_9ROSI|nr:unnamed protein product [Linum tenue]
MFICNHCPFVKHLKKDMVKLSNFYMKDGRRPFELVCHGQFDYSRPNSNVPVTGRDLSRGTDSIQSGQQFHKFRNQGTVHLSSSPCLGSL